MKTFSLWIFHEDLQAFFLSGFFFWVFFFWGGLWVSFWYFTPTIFVNYNTRLTLPLAVTLRHETYTASHCCLLGWHPLFLGIVTRDLHCLSLLRTLFFSLQLSVLNGGVKKNKNKKMVTMKRKCMEVGLSSCCMPECIMFIVMSLVPSQYVCATRAFPSEL